ncbi:MAG TPA: ribosome-associated translation inhibitor RaiA [Candidatus Dormibacteraeota bacterium]|nr:ribosome-associated translation inhibitor RaiA [Candidatus Dormibacteraeota bacterium]
MKVVLHDRTNGLGQEVREATQRKLTRLERHFGKILEAEVEFSEKRRTSDLTWFVCRLHLRLDGHRAPVLHAMERGADATTALDLALDKVDRQLVAFKDKVTHRRQPVSPVRVPPAPEVPTRSQEPERLRLKLRPMSVSEASAELMADSEPFLVYVDEDSGEIQIIVKRADGSLAVIEPVVP